MQSITGSSLTDLLANRPSAVEPLDAPAGPRAQRHALPAGHGIRVGVSGARPAGGGLPVPAQLRPSRWPCGNPELGLADTDAGPTKTAVETGGEASRYWQLCFGNAPPTNSTTSRPTLIALKNLAGDRRISARLRPCVRTFFPAPAAGDPRMESKGDVFDNYPTPTRTARRLTRCNRKAVRAGRCACRGAARPFPLAAWMSERGTRRRTALHQAPRSGGAITHGK